MQTVLQFIGLFLLLILSFLGGNYMLSGDVIISGSVSVVLVIIMYFLIEFLKKRKVQITKSKFSLGSLFLWIIFTSVCIPIGVFLVHALNVEINAKKDLQSYAKELVIKNQEIVNLFQTENQQYVSETYLYVSNELDRYLHAGSATKDSIEELLSEKRYGITDLNSINSSNYLNKAVALQSALEIRSEAVLDSVKDRSESVINDNIYLVDNWSRLRVVTAINELEAMLVKNLNQLNRFLANENYKTDVFANSSSQNDKVLSVSIIEHNQLEIQKSPINLSSFSGLWNYYSPFLLILPALIFFFFLLLPYLLEKTAGSYLINDETENDEGGIEI